MKARFAAALFLFGASGASAGCVVGRLAELPVTMSGLRPTIHAKINGRDVRMFADSGAFFSVISPGSAAELGLHTKPAPYGLYMRGVGGVTSVSVATVRDFTLDTIPLHNMEFVVGGSEVGGEIGQDFGGVIGRNILSYADTEYDLASGAIRLMRTSGCSNHQLAYWATGKPYNVLDILPSTQRRVPPVTVMVSVNGTHLKALLDTGAPASVLSLSAAKTRGVGHRRRRDHPKGRVGRALGGGWLRPSSFPSPRSRSATRRSRTRRSRSWAPICPTPTC